MAVFHRIEMDVIHMSGKVPFVSDEVFPIPALPDAALPFARPAGVPAFPLRDMPRESRFDEHPPSGVVRVTRRQSPNRMQMFRPNHHSGDGERMPLLHHADKLTEDVNGLHRPGPVPFRKINGEKIGAPINSRTPVSHCNHPVS